jgi:molybdopterin synthase sulfur carrier subunit
MAVKVRIPTPLRQLTGGQRVVEVEGRTLAEVIDALERRFPGIKERLIDGDGRLHRFVNVFVNEQDARLLDGLETVLPEVAEVSIIPAMAGGSAPPPKASHTESA